MKIPAEVCILYCEKCDRYDHDILYCFEYRTTMSYFKAKGEKAALERWKKVNSEEEYEDIIEDILLSKEDSTKELTLTLNKKF